eukprot:CAMPEP_0174744890 /NCGR_PEP_ID=MMETSP1094-20130205/85552_1 /TAXON_ID=156173 /ORGANISM="Chrysochromulina brevifilum, Strain UTEX LB 985" /LENGTH=36 /DNA_ID= /DNA_START= /DNA_END= /DNA_ORIENTATION=
MKLNLPTIHEAGYEPLAVVGPPQRGLLDRPGGDVSA